MKFAKLVIVVMCLACTPTKESTKTTSPVNATKPVAAEPVQQSKATQSYEACLEYCISAMDQAGQVTDECPKECREDGNAYTQDDLMDDDQNMGLMVSEKCLKECQTNATDTKVVAGCDQSCCVSSCQLRQEYNGSGMGPECPEMCRDFLKRRLEKPNPPIPKPL